MMCTRVCDRQEDFLPLQSLRPGAVVDEGKRDGRGGGKRVARIIFPRGREKFRKNVIPKLVRDRKEGRKKTLHINVCQWCDWLIGASSNLLLGKVLKSVWIALDSYFKSKARSRCHKQIYSQAYLGYTVKNTLVVTWLLLPTKRTI